MEHTLSFFQILRLNASSFHNIHYCVTLCHVVQLFDAEGALNVQLRFRILQINLAERYR